MRGAGICFLTFGLSICNMPHSQNVAIPSPWAEFLRELDALLPNQTNLNCLGGFVLNLHYALQLPTGDMDYYSIMPVECESNLLTLAGEDSALARKHKLRVHRVTINTMPESWEDRLVEMFPGQFQKLRLYAPDPYDLILSKLERNSPKDRDDVAYLAETCHLRPEALRDRYEKEMRPYLANEARHDLTLNLWLDSCFLAPPPDKLPDHGQ
jgi:uncharacterized nucleotidyltransferase DUF6036